MSERHVYVPLILGCTLVAAAGVVAGVVYYGQRLESALIDDRHRTGYAEGYVDGITRRSPAPKDSGRHLRSVPDAE